LADVTVVDELPPPELDPVVTLLLAPPLPEWTVTELPPVVDPETWPPPAVTELDSVPDGGLSPGLRCTTLHPELLADSSSAADAEPATMPSMAIAVTAVMDLMWALLS
jgi:hypothetical protein